jgi:ATP-binding cassette subfamily C protein CydCD
MGPVDPTLLRALPSVRRASLQLAVVGVASGLIALAQALSAAWMVAALVRRDPLAVPLAVLASTIVLRGSLAAIGEIVARRAGHDVSSAVRIHLLHRWLASPPEQRPAHDAAISLAGVGVTSLEPYVARYLPALVTAAVVPSLAVVVLLWVDPLSALILILTLPLLPLFAALIGKHTADESEQRWSAMHVLAGHFIDVVRGLPTLVAYGRAEHQVENVRAVGDRHRRASVVALRTAFLSSAALELLATISVAMVAVGVGLRLAYGAMDLQVGLAAILLAPEAYWPIRRVGQEFHNASDGAAVLDQVTPGLASDTPRTSERCVDDAVRDVGSFGDASMQVVVDAVSFGYPDRAETIHELTLRTPPGPGMTVLTGPSGSGKSTLLDLMAGVRTPATGTITAGAAHLATQRPLVLPGTVLDALRLAAPHATEAECNEALATVGLWAALEERNGLSTRLGDDGVGLSAGQRTRLTLARASLARSSLVLLDEPTAHVDLDDLDALRDVVVAMSATRRVVVATHDLALVARGDSVWEMPVDPPLEIESVGSTTSSRMRTDVGTASTIPLSWWQRRTVTWRLSLACVLGGLSMASGVALTATSGWLIVEASTQPVVLTLLVAIVGVRAFGISRPILRYAERVVSHDAALETLTDRRVGVFRSLIPLTPARLGRHHRGDLLTAVVTDLDDAVDEQVRVRVPWWSTAIASASAAAILLVVLPLAAVVVVAGAVLAFGVAGSGSHIERAAQSDSVRARGEVQRVTTTLVDRLDHVRAVIGPHVGAAAPLVDTVDRAHRAYAVAETRLIRTRAVSLMALWSVLALTVVVVALVAAAAVNDAAISGPVAALVALTPIALSDGWVGLADIGGARARAEAAETRLIRVLEQPSAVIDRGVESAPHGVVPVVAEDVRASWSEQQHPLGPFTLPRLEKGACIQLTGPNGLGKSTMLAVLARHLTPVSGTHLLAGIPAADVRLADARADIAIVDDEPHAFAGSIRANLALAAPAATDDELVASLDAADLSQWFDRQPDGLDTLLAGLSGGERTRVAIARAVLSQRRLVLLDEPAAHLDEATAARALRQLMGDPGVAVLAVSHQPLPLADGLRTTRLDAAGVLFECQDDADRHGDGWDPRRGSVV